MGFHVFFMLSDSFKLYYDKGKASPFRARKVLGQSLERKTPPVLHHRILPLPPKGMIHF